MARPAAILARGFDVGCVVVLLAVLGFYATRIVLPVPLYAGDEGAYLIRALFSPNVAARDPLLAELNNSVFLAFVRGMAALPGPDLAWLRLADAAAYLGGLVAVHQVAMRGLTGGQRWAFLILALAFPYYRFVVTALPEGLYVLGLGLIVAVTAGLYQRRPALHGLAAGALHGLAAGALAAGLALVKPHGVAVAAALAALMALEALASGRWRVTPVRIAAFAAAFFAVGVGVQAAAGAPVASPLTFFMGAYYERAVGLALPPEAGVMGLLAAASMGGAVLVLAGPALVVGLAGLAGRRRELDGRDLAFSLVVLSLAASLAMVTIYAMKLAGDPGETHRLWGRYFEFFTPLLWLTAAPYLAAGPLSRRLRLACAGAVLAGLAALLASFAGGIVLFPWDSTALMAFFAPDPVRAPVPVRLPYRLLAVAATLGAVAALMLRLGAVRAWTGYLLVLAVLSTWLDKGWIGPMVDKREAFHAEALAVKTIVREPGRDAVLVTDNNDAHLGFLAFDGQAQVLVAPADALGFDTLVVIAPATAPAGWRPRFEGAQVSVYERAP